MNDIIMMLLSCLGAVAGAVVLLTGVGVITTAGAAIVTGAGSVAVAVMPAAVCLGGVAYAASKTGYGGL